ncbi:hypothetical protein FUT87_17610 [Mitsuaria sp. TWR114]|uniref:hypothetical protein n=1 Tax=Mitsuaria sp. TWR114 TaxID=2601731 RepID=UPI0011BDA751|nr:hypothetical protein [Mitsuaria sp. TWR114]TXD81728.1 hypothetical protein FUT87_17610 [Mitsuaria sp. TWR114]
MNEPDITPRFPTAFAARSPACSPTAAPVRAAHQAVARAASSCAAALAASGRPARLTPELPCYAYSPWTRFPVIGPALTVLIAIVSALALVSNANAFNDVNAELQITRASSGWPSRRRSSRPARRPSARPCWSRRAMTARRR